MHPRAAAVDHIQYERLQRNSAGALALVDRAARSAWLKGAWRGCGGVVRGSDCGVQASGAGWRKGPPASSRWSST